MNNTVAGVTKYNLATKEVFPQGALNVKVDMLICSFVFDDLCTDPSNLEVVMKQLLHARSKMVC